MKHETTRCSCFCSKRDSFRRRVEGEGGKLTTESIERINNCPYESILIAFLIGVDR